MYPIIMMEEESKNVQKRPKGRPRKYFCQADFKQAQKTYRKEWYERNKEKVSEKHSSEEYIEKRNNRRLQGFYMIYSDDSDDVRVAHSNDVTNRAGQILRKIKDADSSGKLIDKFDKSKQWKYKMIEFWDDKHDSDRLDKIYHDLKKNNSKINFI